MIYKVNYKINGQYGSYVFNYKTEEEKDGKLKEWKDEHLTPYNKIEILWYGTLDKWEEEQKPIAKFLTKKMISI